MKVAVVTPTTGAETLRECLRSVQEQVYDDYIEHYVVMDGSQYFDNIMSHIFSTRQTHTIKTIALEDNVGAGGWYGHRVYAACSFLVNADIICYLDQDNWILPNHIESLVSLIKKNDLQWAFSLRNIHDKDGSFICRDDCESLGKWPAFHNNDVFHVDTSCFAVTKKTAVSVGHAWYGQWGADRQFFNAAKTYFPKYDCTGQYTMCYRVDGNPNSPNKDFFLAGNSIQKQKYNNNFPWTSNG